MRSLSAWFLALLMLLSSGSMQLVLHSCPGSGVFLFTDCGMHESQETSDLPECCKKKVPARAEKEDCGNCEDFFVFSITPKFGSIATAETGEPPVYVLSQNIVLADGKSAVISHKTLQVQRERPPKLLEFQARHCTWLI